MRDVMSGLELQQGITESFISLSLSGILSPFLELLEDSDFKAVAEGLLAFVRWELDLNVERKDLEAKVILATQT